MMEFAAEAAPKPKSDLESSNLILERLARAVTTKTTTRGPVKTVTTAKTPAKLMVKPIVPSKPITAKAAAVDSKKIQITAKKVAAAVATKKTPTMATVAKPVTIAKLALSAIKKAAPIQKNPAPQVAQLAPKVAKPSVAAKEVEPSASQQAASKSLIEVYGKFLDPKIAQELNLKEASSLQEVLKALPSAVGKYHNDVNQVELNRAVDMIVKPGGFDMLDLPNLINAYKQSGLSAAVDTKAFSEAHKSLDNVKDTLKSAGLNINNQ